MSDIKGWKIAVAAVVLGGAAYGLLEHFRPLRHTEVKSEGLVPTEAVFDGGATSEPAAPAEAGSSAPTADSSLAPTEPAPKAPDASAAAEPATAPASTVASAPAAPAAEPATPAAAPVSASAAPSPAPTPAPAPPPAEPVAQAEPAAAPEPIKPAPSASKPAAPKLATGSANTAWWQSASNSNGLSISFVGTASFKTAVVVISNGSFDSAAAANRSLKVYDAGGKRVKGQWEVSPNNHGLLVFAVPHAGSYVVQLDAALHDQQNHKLAKSARGWVEVR